MITETTIYNTKSYCKDNIEEIEGYIEAITSEEKYCCHHRNGLYISKEELIQKCLYYDRPASELIWMEIGEHRRLHNQNLREESKQKKSDAMKGENHPMYGKHHTNEAKEKISNSKKGKNKGENNPWYGKHHTNEAKEKMSNAKKGKQYTEETKQKMSDAHKGEKNPRAKQCTIHGKIYGCLKDAHKALYPNMPWSTFYYKYKEGKL